MLNGKNNIVVRPADSRQIMGIKELIKKETKITIFSFIILILVLLGLIWILLSTTLSPNEKISNIILLLTCTSGIMATLFLIGNYNVVKQSFMKSLEPSLLMVLAPEFTKFKDGKTLPIPQKTGRNVIHYENPTNNAFTDLTIKIKLYSNNRYYDVSYLFSENMYMGPHDKRNRVTNFIEEAKKNNLDILQTSRSGSEVKLLLSFSYTFNGERKTYNIQEYIYKPDNMDWDII